MSDTDAWLSELRAGLERRVATSGAQPDFLDVVMRAQVLDPERFDDDALELAQRLSVEHGAEDVAELDDEWAHSSAGSSASSPARSVRVDALDPWLDDVRAVVDRRVEQRSERPLPALPRPPRSRRAMWWVGGAVAAAVLLAVGIGRIASTLLDADPTLVEEQAVHSSVPSDTEAEIDAAHGGRLGERGPVSSGARGNPSSVQATTSSEDRGPTEAEPDAASADTEGTIARADLEDEGDTDAIARPARARDRKTDRLAQLTEQAQAHWRAGRRAEAIRLFTEVVEQGGRSRVAEMAYADLFTLAHQQHDAAAQRRWWSAYLRRFPRGRFADDARAGLCRGRSGDEATACWQDYLAREPGGSYRAEARAALGEAPR